MAGASTGCGNWRPTGARSSWAAVSARNRSRFASGPGERAEELASDPTLKAPARRRLRSMRLPRRLFASQTSLKRRQQRNQIAPGHSRAVWLQLDGTLPETDLDAREQAARERRVHEILVSN